MFALSCKQGVTVSVAVNSFNFQLKQLYTTKSRTYSSATFKRCWRHYLFVRLLMLFSRYPYEYTVSGKKHGEHYRLSLEVGISNFHNFWYDCFWHNWPSNDRSVFHLTQCLLLHYIGKTKPMKVRINKNASKSIPNIIATW